MMNTTRAVGKNSTARIEYVPRRLSALTSKIQPVDDKEQFSPTMNTGFLDGLPSLSMKSSIKNQSSIRNTDDGNLKGKSESVVSPISSPDHMNNIKLIKDSKDGCCQWFSRLTSKQKTIFKLIIVVFILCLITTAIVLPVYFFVIRQDRSQSSFTNTTASVCSTSTCIGKETPYRTSIITTLYTFDGNYNDQTGFATGIPYGISTPSVSSAGYVSQSITLTSTSYQYVQIPNINFAKQSFTLQTWIYPSNPNSLVEFGIFGQCDSNMMCLLLSIRNARITFAFDSSNSTNQGNTLIGSTVITNNWYHVTAVYDAVLFQQRIYVNGQIDSISYGMINSYQGISSSSTITTIGRTTSSYNSTTYFNGRIDHFTSSVGTARTTCQISNDASLVVYFPFDTIGTFNDYSVNVCNGIGLSVPIVSTGRINQAISFPANTSYFQANCFPKMRGNQNAYSFSLWINPSSTIGGTLIHISSNSGGNVTCYDALVFTVTGNLVMQWMLNTLVVVNVQGPVIPINTWTHIAVVYMISNGIRLYINGQFSVSSSNTGNLNLYDTTSANYITLGNVGSLGPVGSISCANGAVSVLPGSFTGLIDEFRLYNRELDNQEICVLANP